MLEAFKWSRKSDRDFHTHFWKKIPIPRFDNTNEIHLKLSSLGKKSERLAKKEDDDTTQKLRIKIREKLQKSDVMSEIDECCKKIFDGFL